jgi:indole-3-glycerol phosphate synthase
MEAASSLGCSLIGINSRDLKTFKTDLSVIERIAKLSPRSALLVAESGIKNRADVDRLRSSGISAILVGETLMRAPNIAAAVADLVQ